MNFSRILKLENKSDAGLFLEGIREVRKNLYKKVSPKGATAVDKLISELENRLKGNTPPNAGYYHPKLSWQVTSKDENEDDYKDRKKVYIAGNVLSIIFYVINRRLHFKILFLEANGPCPNSKDILLSFIGQPPLMYKCPICGKMTWAVKIVAHPRYMDPAMSNNPDKAFVEAKCSNPECRNPEEVKERDFWEHLWKKCPRKIWP